MALKTRMWSAGKLLLLGGALVATYGVFAAASMRLALRAREVQVPDLTNHSANEATTIAAGHVITQEPVAGTTARRQRSVKVWLSAGPRATTVPVLTGESERAAQFRLAQDGLAILGVSEIRTATYASDIVVAQDPAAHGVGAGVSLLVNRGTQGATYVMPDLIGVNGDRAAEVLRGHGFRVAVVGSTPYPGIASGIVVRQSPQAGFQIAPGEPISLEVSR